MGQSPIYKSLLKLCVSVPLCEITPTRETVLVCFVAESLYTIYMFYTAKINHCVTVTDPACPGTLRPAAGKCILPLQ